MNGFKIGDRVIMDRKQFIIAAYNRDKVVLIPSEQSGYVQVVRPYYTQWSKS